MMLQAMRFMAALAFLASAEGGRRTLHSAQGGGSKGGGNGSGTGRGTVVVHVGLPKTGTTYIQQYLTTNRNLLQPWLSYDPGPLQAHHFIVNRAGNMRALDQAASRRLLLERILASNISTHLISTESICTVKPSELQKLARALRPLQVHSVLFYRNLASFSISMYKQLVRTLDFDGAVGSFADFYFHRGGDGHRSWILSTISRLQAHLGPRLSIIDYAGAKAAGDIADALLKVASLGSHFLRDNPATRPTRGEPTSRGDEALRGLLLILRYHAQVVHNCRLKWDPSSVFVTNLSASLLLGRHQLPLQCPMLEQLRAQAYHFDNELRRSYGALFVPEYANPDAAHLEIKTLSLDFCDLDRTQVLENPQVWGPRFDEQLRALPTWMVCEHSS